MTSTAVWPWLLTVGALAGMVVAWWVGRGGWKMFRRADGEMSRRLDDLTLEVVELRLLLSDVMIGTAKLIVQLEGAGLEPEYRLPNERKKGLMGAESDSSRLHRQLMEYFNNAELDELAFGLGIGPEEFGGHDLPSRALALIAYASRHGLLERLTDAARKARPQVRWPWITSL